jgi:aryl-alcohol dehydrogenase-like predicted oxidoreductase
MKKRNLGNSGMEVAPLALGTNVFGWTIDEPTSFEILDAFVDAGFNLIDTADVYSSWKPGNKGGESETIIGKWIRNTGKRDRIVLATKVGGSMSQGKVSLAKEYITKAVEDSLIRLQTDHIDLYQSHWDDLDIPVEEPLDTYAQLIKAGKVRAIGASNFSKERLQQAIDYSEQNGMPRYETLQPEYNLYNRADFEKDLAPFCIEKGIGIINYFPLASGFLSGKYRSKEDASKSMRGGGIINRYLNERGLNILKALDTISDQFNTNPSTIAIAWNMAQPGIIAPIASATSTLQLEDLIQAAQLELDAESLALLNQASSYA